MSQSSTCSLVDSCDKQYEARQVIPGIETVGVRLTNQSFSRHSHDTYTVVVTTEGVQEFYYRGTTHRSTPGQLVVLHPGEVHDGRPGGGSTFAYVGLQIAASAARRYLPEHLGRRALPFVTRPVFNDSRLVKVVRRAAAATDGLLMHGLVTNVLEAICQLSSDAPQFARAKGYTHRIANAEQYLRDNATRPVQLVELQQECGLSVSEICRQFKSRYGISPYRFLLMRRVQVARDRIRAGLPLSEAAIAAGFSDQPHMTRAFRSFLGLTPGVFAALHARTAVEQSTNEVWRREQHEEALPSPSRR